MSETQPTALEDLCDSALSLMFDASPFAATSLGIPGWDDKVPEVDREASRRHADSARAIAAKAEAIDVATLSDADRVTRAILIHEASVSADATELRMIEFTTAPMFVAPHAPVLQTMPKTVLADAARADAYLERLSGLASYLDSAGQQLLAGTAEGRTAAARSLAGSIGAVDAYLASDLESDLLHVPAAPEWDGKAAFEERRTALVRDHVRPALARLRDTYKQLLGSARPDDKVGVGWLPDGEHVYEVCAREHTSTDLKPQELHQLGLDVLEQLKAEYAEIGARVFGTSDPAEVLDRMRNDPGVRLGSVDELLTISQAALDRCQAALPDWFGLLPASDCVMQQIPDEEAKTSAPAYYTPPDASTGRRGTYWVNGHEITKRAKLDVETIAFHEAIPGHHLQLAIAQQMTELPLFRRVNISTAYAEGWGLYSERLADEMGLYSSDLQRLGMLQCDSWRACRLVVDSGLHAMGWSFERAVQFMTENSAVPLSVVTPEVDRYVGMPGQALGYMVGRKEIERMRREATVALGPAFDIKGFHDAVLGAGSLPLAVLDGEVKRWVAAQR